MWFSSCFCKPKHLRNSRTKQGYSRGLTWFDVWYRPLIHCVIWLWNITCDSTACPLWQYHWIRGATPQWKLRVINSFILRTFHWLPAVQDPGPSLAEGALPLHPTCWSHWGHVGRFITSNLAKACWAALNQEILKIHFCTLSLLRFVICSIFLFLGDPYLFFWRYQPFGSHLLTLFWR